MRTYETIIITKPDVNEGYVSGLTKKIEKVVGRKPGELIRKDDWGLKRLAYPIAKQQKGRYLYWNYSQLPDAIFEIERHLKFDESVVRYLTVVTDGGKSDTAPKEVRKPKGTKKGEA